MCGRGVMDVAMSVPPGRCLRARGADDLESPALPQLRSARPSSITKVFSRANTEEYVFVELRLFAPRTASKRKLDLAPSRTRCRAPDEALLASRTRGSGARQDGHRR